MGVRLWRAFFEIGKIKAIGHRFPRSTSFLDIGDTPSSVMARCHSLCTIIEAIS